ncbi:MAG: hypothetical protein PHF24_01655 [Syntrophomonas sp.]|nr:hypothetical protein [Syntrophomonas sp.]
MNNKLKPFYKIILILVVVIMLYFRPTREFLKLTFMLGMPFALILGFMVRRPRSSPGWYLCVLGLIGILALYGYYLIHLPERIELREIISNGAALTAEGHFDEAIEKYAGLEKLGKRQKMEEMISKVQTEKEAHVQLEKARQLIEAGQKDEAQKIIEALPRNTRAAQEARDLRKGLE